MLTYQTATTNDIEAIYLLNKENMDLYEDLSRLDYDYVLKYLYHDIADHIDTYKVVYLDHQKVGYYCIEEVDHQLEIIDLYILEPYRHLGLGKQVLEKIIQETSLPLFLYAFSKNKGAIRLYERFGFKITEVLSPTRIKMEKDCL